MSGATRPVRPDELGRLWPLVRSSHVFGDCEELASFSQDAPWRVRASDTGDAMVLDRWRSHLDALSIRALLASDARIPELVDDARAVARSQGLTEVLSPLVIDPGGEYVAAGMEPFARIIAFASSAGELRIPAQADDDAFLRQAMAGDVDALARIEASCFDDFWRQGYPEMVRDISSQRITIAEDDAGAALGYSASIRRGSLVTLGRLAVAPHARRRGVACSLIRDVEAWADSVNAAGISLCTQEDNLGARSLYESVGFTQAPGRYMMLRTSV